MARISMLLFASAPLALAFGTSTDGFCQQCTAECPAQKNQHTLARFDAAGDMTTALYPSDWKADEWLSPAIYFPGEDGILDMAIVGAGLGSSYVLWNMTLQAKADRRLQEDTASRQCDRGVFEKSQRIGGRFMSQWTAPAGVTGWFSQTADTSVPGFKAGEFVKEFGGMRIFPEVMHLMNGIVNEFNPPTGDESYSPLLQKEALTTPSNFYYDPINVGPDVRESREAKGTKYKEFLSYWPTAKNDWLLQQGLSDAELEALTLEEKIKMLNTVTVQQVFEETVGPEKFGEYIAAYGYELMVGNVSAALWDHDEQTLTGYADHYLVNGGWSGMVKRMLGNANVGVAFDAKLIEVTTNQEGLVVLRFEDGSTQIARSAYISAQPSVIHEVKGLEKITDLASKTISFSSGAKFFLTWTDPWFEERGYTGGRTVANTKLVRQVFYWDKWTMQLYQSGVINTDADHTLQMAPPWCPDQLASCEHEGMFATETIGTTADNEGMQKVVDELMKELREIHGWPEMPYPDLVRYKWWPISTAKRRSNVDSVQLMEDFRRPLGQDVPVWYGSSMVSEWQGWGEGALQLAQLNLPEIMQFLKEEAQCSPHA